MKTSELKRIAEENGYKFQKTKHFIFIRMDDSRVIGLDLDNNNVVLYECDSLNTDGNKKIMVALIEYSLTPLNEREDEKKYIIKSSIGTNAYNHIYLAKEMDVLLTEQFTQVFTQSDIDNFPSEIKGAIECGFLRKVEVE